jgi:hypothetical protein
VPVLPVLKETVNPDLLGKVGGDLDEVPAARPQLRMRTASVRITHPPHTCHVKDQPKSAESRRHSLHPAPTKPGRAKAVDLTCRVSLSNTTSVEAERNVAGVHALYEWHCGLGPMLRYALRSRVGSVSRSS